MDHEPRRRALEAIRDNIARFGYHLYVVKAGLNPRWAYTIGISPKLGYELVFAGGILFMYEEVSKIVRATIEQLTTKSAFEGTPCSVDPFGNFSFRKIDPTWGRLLILGANDFYQQTDVPGIQIVPDQEHTTIDVPDMTVPFNPQSSPVWQWLTEPWKYSVPVKSHALADLDALRGSPVTEACRWEDDYWELFAGAGPDVPDEERRVVSLGTLLAADPSLTPVLELKIGDGIWREANSEWHIWKSSEAKEGPPA